MQLKLQIFLTICLLAIVGFVQAQEYTYVPIPKSNTTWNTCKTFPRTYNGMYEKYFTLNDTIIDNNLCTKLFVHNRLLSSPTYIGAYYEQNKEVFFYKVNGEKEKIYDFNITLGDTIKWAKIQMPEYQYTLVDNDSVLRVESIDTVLVDGTKRLKYNFHPLSTSIFEVLVESWIEGVGSVHGFLSSLNLRFYQTEVNEKEDLTCFFINDDRLWHNELYSTCFDIEWLNAEILKTSQVDIYPNPSSDYLYINTNNKSISNILLVDMLGKIVKTTKLAVEDSECQTSFDVSSISKGNYILIFTDKTGNIQDKTKIIIE